MISLVESDDLKVQSRWFDSSVQIYLTIRETEINNLGHQSPRIKTSSGDAPYPRILIKFSLFLNFRASIELF